MYRLLEFSGSLDVIDDHSVPYGPFPIVSLDSFSVRRAI